MLEVVFLVNAFVGVVHIYGVAGEVRAMKEAGETKIEIHGGGMGCALIRTEVFRKLSYPWYDWVNYGDANRGMLSEDLYFCALAASVIDRAARMSVFFISF